MWELLSQQFNHFERGAVIPGDNFKEALSIFLAWALPAFLFVLSVDAFFPEVNFYQAAISEGVGPNLWNAIGSFGLFSFGISVMFPKSHTCALVARHILVNTYAIGCLTFGLLVGQWCVLPSTEWFAWWQWGLFGVTSGFLLVVVFLYNLAVWYLSFLVQEESGRKSGFLGKMEHVHWVWRTVIGLFIALLTTLLFTSAA